MANRWTKESLAFMIMIEHPSDDTENQIMNMFVDCGFFKHKGNCISMQKPPRWNLILNIFLSFHCGQRNPFYIPCPLGPSHPLPQPEPSSSHTLDRSFLGTEYWPENDRGNTTTQNFCICELKLIADITACKNGLQEIFSIISPQLLIYVIKNAWMITYKRKS